MGKKKVKWYGPQQHMETIVKHDKLNRWKHELLNNMVFVQKSAVGLVEPRHFERMSRFLKTGGTLILLCFCSGS